MDGFALGPAWPEARTVAGAELRDGCYYWVHPGGPGGRERARFEHCAIWLDGYDGPIDPGRVTVLERHPDQRRPPGWRDDPE